MVGILYPRQMGPAQGLLTHQEQQLSQMAAPTGGLLAQFLPQVAGNPLYAAFDRGRNAISMALLNSAGQSGAAGMRAAGQGAAAGMQLDQARAAERQKQEEAQRSKNATIEWLTGKFGLSESDAIAAAGNPNILNHYLKAASDKTSGVDYGLNPQYGVDDAGNPVLIQMGKDGKAIRTAMPEGVTLSKEPIKLDAGTHFVLLDPITRQPVGQIPKDNRGAARETALGKAEGETIAGLPQDILTAEQTVTEIDALMKHGGLESIVGPLDQYRQSWMLGNEGRDALARFNQLKGRAFLQAYATLKGGGQITEIEGIKAEQAMARMDRAQGEAEFREALKDFRDAVEAGMRKLRQQAGAAMPGETVPGSAGNRTGTGIQWSVEP